MTLKVTGGEELIGPRLNRTYWEGLELRDGRAELWPERGEPEQPELIITRKALLAYKERGVDQPPLEVIAPGTLFVPTDYPVGTVIRTVLENLVLDRQQTNALPMSYFENYPLPKTPNLSDGEQLYVGYGYRYGIQERVNVITGGRAGTCLMRPEDLFADKTGAEFNACIKPGTREFTVGKAFHFRSDHESLARVSYAEVCMHAIRVKKKSK